MRFMGTFTGWRAGVAIRMHYFRGGWRMSSCREGIGLPVVRRSMVSPSAVAGAAALTGLMLAAVAVWAQYPGQITKKSKDTPDLRAVAVLEWTGVAGKPKACRIVPVTVFDGEKLQDAGG